jgi:hypothetical protein
VRLLEDEEVMVHVLVLSALRAGLFCLVSEGC